MSKNLCQILEGRLLKIDVAAGYQSVADVDEMIRMIRGEVGKIPEPTKIVIAADWRPCKLLSQDVADRAVMMLSSANPRIERSAILHRDGAPTSVLQVMRLIREGGSSSRRVFTEAEKMQAWLGEALTEAERAQLKTFLSQRY